MSVSRDMTAAASAAITMGNVPMVMFVELDFKEGFTRINNSPINVPWNGFEWIGLGTLGTVEKIAEVSDMSSNTLALKLSGVPPQFISLALDSTYQGRSCKIWFAPLTSVHQVIINPIGSWDFRMDTMDIDLGKQATITVNVESRFVDWERSSVSRYTDEEQKRLFPGDTGCQFVPQMAEKEIQWGYG